MSTPIDHFTIDALPNTPLNRQELANAIAARLHGVITAAFGFVEGGAEPTTDQGPWHPAGAAFWEFWNATLGKYVPSPQIETGMIFPFAGSTPPGGYLLCDGSAVSQTTYPALFVAIGYGYSLPDGTGSQTADTTSLTGSSQFRLPDFRGRVIVGAGSGTPNNTGGTNLLTPRAIGQRLGQESITLKPEDLPNFDIPVFEYDSAATQANRAIYGGYKYDPGSGVYHYINTTTSGATNNMPPFGVALYIIRT